jgi:hypothetical protein
MRRLLLLERPMTTGSRSTFYREPGREPLTPNSTGRSMEVVQEEEAGEEAEVVALEPS